MRRLADQLRGRCNKAFAEIPKTAEIPKANTRASGAGLRSSPPNATSSSSGWRLLVLSATAAIFVIVAAPTLLSYGRPESAALYAAFASLCHQAPERSWTVLGYPLAVCTRCFGFYCGVFAAFCMGSRFSLAGFWASAIAMIATVAFESTQLFVVPPAIRFLSGAWLGLAMASALCDWVLPTFRSDARFRGLLASAPRPGSDQPEAPVHPPTALVR